MREFISCATPYFCVNFGLYVQGFLFVRGLLSFVHICVYASVGALRRGIMVGNLVSLDHLRLNSKFDTHCVLHTLGLVSHLSPTEKKSTVTSVYTYLYVCKYMWIIQKHRVVYFGLIN